MIVRIEEGFSARIFRASPCCRESRGSACFTAKRVYVLIPTEPTFQGDQESAPTFQNHVPTLHQAYFRPAILWRSERVPLFCFQSLASLFVSFGVAIRKAVAGDQWRVARTHKKPVAVHASGQALRNLKTGKWKARVGWRWRDEFRRCRFGQFPLGHFRRRSRRGKHFVRHHLM